MHTLDDTKHEHPLRHHFSINRAKEDDGDEHHNLVVSYENSIVNEYSEYYWGFLGYFLNFKVNFVKIEVIFLKFEVKFLNLRLGF